MQLVPGNRALMMDVELRDGLIAELLDHHTLRHARPRIVKAVVQQIIENIAMDLDPDPEIGSIERDEVLALCLETLEDALICDCCKAERAAGVS